MQNKAKTIGTDTNAKQCFSYIRFSSRKQAKGDSKRRQTEIAPRVAKDKGWVLREDLNAADLGVSAYKGHNYATIRAIIDAVKSGKIPQGTVMILEALDRLTRRDIDQAAPLLWEILGSGLEIWIDHTSRHLTKDSLKNVTEMMMVLAELKGAHEYSATIARRGGKAWKRKKAAASEGIIVTKMTPAWLSADRRANTFTVDEEKANIVRRIFNNYADGKGVRTIMRDLNGERVAPFGKGKQNLSGKWSSTHLRRLLSFRGTIGEYQPYNSIDGKRIPDGDAVANYYPAIVEKPLFYKVQEILAKVMSNGRTGHASGPKNNATNLFTGLVKCAVCGSSMVIKQSGLHQGKYAYTSLICYNAARGAGCKYHTIQYHLVERAVLTLLFSKVVPAMAQSDTRKENLATLEGELKNAHKQKTKWLEYADKSESVDDVAAQKINLWDTKERALARQIQSLSATINDNPLAGWQHVENTPDNRLRLQAILANEIESLTVDAGNRYAALTVKEPQMTFEIGWPDAKGTNATKQNIANRVFYCAGYTKPFAYLDQILVWKSAHNRTVEDLLRLTQPDETAASDDQANVRKVSGRVILELT